MPEEFAPLEVDEEALKESDEDSDAPQDGLPAKSRGGKGIWVVCACSMRAAGFATLIELERGGRVQ
jgi:hypothetical protein